MALFSILKSVPQCVESQSGKFLVDKEGIALSFEPSKDNELIIEDTEFQKNYYANKISRTIRTFIVPEGVKGFVSEFMRHTRVIEKFKLPNSLLSIGNNSFDIGNEIYCVFANCILPSVSIPESVKEIGNFAFGHSIIDTLQFPPSLRSPYGRQFKDSHIGTLILPKEWENTVSLNEDCSLNVALDHENFGYLWWPSTSIEKLIFY